MCTYMCIIWFLWSNLWLGWLSIDDDTRRAILDCLGSLAFFAKWANKEDRVPVTIELMPSWYVLYFVSLHKFALHYLSDKCSPDGLIWEGRTCKTTTTKTVAFFGTAFLICRAGKNALSTIPIRISQYKQLPLCFETPKLEQLYKYQIFGGHSAITVVHKKKLLWFIKKHKMIYNFCFIFPFWRLFRDFHTQVHSPNSLPLGISRSEHLKS